MLKENVKSGRDVLSLTRPCEVAMAGFCQGFEHRAVRIASQSEGKDANRRRTSGVERRYYLLQVSGSESGIRIGDEDDAVFSFRKGVSQFDRFSERFAEIRAAAEC